MSLSGWCTGPTGARPPHHTCPSTTCTCDCGPHPRTHTNNDEERDT